MQTLEQFIESDYFSTRSLHFDRTMYSLIVDIERICRVLNEADIPFELIGGVGVLAHILDRERSRSFVTRDVDVLVRRKDLDRLVTAAEAAGYQARKIVGGYMLLRPGQIPGEAVHLIFAGERSKSTQPIPHPEVTPVRMRFFELSVPVAPLADLVEMKLNSLRGKDMHTFRFSTKPDSSPSRSKANCPTSSRKTPAGSRAVPGREAGCRALKSSGLW